MSTEDLDDRLHAAGELRERRNHPKATQKGNAKERVELLEPVHLDPLELAARIDAARSDVHLVAALGEPPGPASEMARLRIADPEDAQPVRHRG